MDENLRIYWAISHKTWQICSSHEPIQTLCGNCKNFDFSAGCAARNVQKFHFLLFLNILCGANGRKSSLKAIETNQNLPFQTNLMSLC